MARIRSFAALVTLTLLLAACGGSGGQEAPPTSERAPTATPLPTPTETPAPPPPSLPQAAPAPEIGLPAGFTAFAIATGLEQPTSIAVSADGDIYVSERLGEIHRLVDNDGDGVFEQLVTFAVRPADLNGIAFSPQGSLYASSTGTVTVLRDTDGDTVADVSEQIIAGLPNGRHQNNGLAFGPDGKLYITNGSTCDECVEVDERSATILQANPDGSDLRIYARGLRNTYDLTFDAQGRLWATDNGSDDPCATIDELNLVEDGGDYGWPYGQRCDPYLDGIAPEASLGLHTAATGIDSYDAAQFPERYRGDLFTTFWGSFVFAPDPISKVLVHIALEETPTGLRATMETFGTGFENPVDVVVDRDGTLLVLDFGSGTLYRIAYTGV